MELLSHELQRAYLGLSGALDGIESLLLVIALLVGAYVVSRLLYAALVASGALPTVKSAVWYGLVESAELVEQHDGAPCCEHGEDGKPIAVIVHTDVRLQGVGVIRIPDDVRGICAVGSTVRILRSERATFTVHRVTITASGTA